MYRRLQSFVTGPGAIALLIVRIVFGLGLMFHGWSKINDPFHWMGPHAWAPGFLQALAALAEFGGGFALIVGLLTPLAALGVICNMLVAIIGVHLAKGDPFVAAPGHHGSYESALGYLTVATLLLLMGPGMVSLDALIWGNLRRSHQQHLKKRSFLAWR